MSNRSEELKQLFVNYMNAMEENGLSGIAEYYHEPTMIINQNRVTVLESRSQVEELFAPMLEAFAAQDFDHMEAVEMNAKTLSKDTAVVSNVVVRYKKDGSELNRASAMYTLHKNSQGWKIASLVIGDPDSVIRFS
jgi:ketosteroid isomerase-like protein